MRRRRTTRGPRRRLCGPCGRLRPPAPMAGITALCGPRRLRRLPRRLCGPRRLRRISRRLSAAVSRLRRLWRLPRRLATAIRPAPIGAAGTGMAATGRAPIYGWGFAWFLPVLPLAYATYWYGGVPYYYANDVYYTWDPSYSGYVATDPPPVAIRTVPPRRRRPPPQAGAGPMRTAAGLGAPGGSRIQRPVRCFTSGCGASGRHAESAPLPPAGAGPDSSRGRYPLPNATPPPTAIR